MTTVPPEIWLHIAEFIPKEDLRNMLTVNSAFFHLVMSARYYEVILNTFHDRETLLGLLRRLRDPGIAQHVRRLHVLAMFSRKFCDEYQARHSRRPWQVRQGELSPHSTLDIIDNSLDEVIQAMTETVTYLTNTTHLIICWKHMSPAVKHFRPLLHASWRAIGPNVQKLELMASLKYMPSVISTAMTSTFAELRTLKVRFYYRERLEDQEGPRTTWIDTMVPFINKVAPTLRSLSLLISTPELEVSSFLNQLEHIPHLDRLCIGDHRWQSHFLENLTGLTRFLQSHAETLRCFCWPVGLPDDRFRPKDGPSGEELLVEFLSRNRLDAVFSNLLKLEFPVPASDVGFRLLIQYIQRSAPTLIYLKLWDRFLTYHKVDMLVSVFGSQASNLKKLVLFIQALSPHLVHLLARTYPHLETLHITAAYVVPHNENGRRVPQTAEERLSCAREFAHRLREYDFRDWSLNDIDLQPRYHDNLPLYTRVMLLFGECIPSMRKFQGSDKKPSCIQDVPDDELRL